LAVLVVVISIVVPAAMLACLNLPFLPLLYTYRYEQLELLLEQCYPTTPLRPSPEELRELFRATSAG
jgi:hypothetical protein